MVIDLDMPWRHALIVAPHPDDETLGCAGIIRGLLDAGVACTVLAATDGEASHARSARATPQQLVRIRAAERRRALARIGAAHVPIVRLGLPDGGLRHEQDPLRDAIRALVTSDALVITPWQGDRHPDHVAVAGAGEAVARDVGCGRWEVPIWGRVHGVDEAHDVIPLGAFAATKRAAVAEFASQLRPLGSDPEDGPVVHPWELAAMVQDDELVIRR